LIFLLQAAATDTQRYLQLLMQEVMVLPLALIFLLQEAATDTQRYASAVVERMLEKKQFIVLLCSNQLCTTNFLKGAARHLAHPSRSGDCLINIS
jgi:hypothetical protein